MNTISKFSGKYSFLSNMFDSFVMYEGRRYPCAECAFQSAKSFDEYDKLQFLICDGREAKKLGRKVSLRPDWESVKVDVMYKILKSKFQNPELSKLLLETGDCELIEGNTWGDQFWGVCKGVGENNLGKLLMKVREELHGDIRS